MTKAEDVSLVLLAATAGLMDALAFLRLGQALVSAMTGNAALLGLAIGQQQYGAALHSGIAFAGFVLGVMLAASLFGADPPRGWSRRVTIAFAAEAVLLGGFALLWIATLGARPATVVYALILLAAAGMGVQSAAVRHLDVPGIATTFLTGTLTTIILSVARLAAPSMRRSESPANALRQVMVLAAYLIGAAFSGLAASHGTEAIAVLPFAAVLIVLGLHLVLD